MVIGFFMPLPLAMMIPFMGIQSAVMAKQFGENFQYGKRRISAMDNDEFNKLTPAKLMSNANRELAEMIPAMKDSIIGMHDFQEFLIREFLIMVDNVIKAGLGELLGLSQSSLDKIENTIEHYLHGHIHFGTGGGNGGTGGGNGGDDETTTTLLDPSFNTVKGWTVTKLNLEHDFNLNKYTSQAQGFIHSVHDFNKDSDSQPGTDLDDIILTNWKAILDNWYAKSDKTIGQLFINNWRLKTTRLELASAMNPVYGSSQDKIQQEELAGRTNSITIKAHRKVIKAMNEIILLANEFF